MNTRPAPLFSENDFVKSSHCVYPPGGCVEVAAKDGIIAVRDAKNPEQILRFNKAEWSAFVDGVKNGEFDLR
jgi:hypothetical protein